jgi:hypothetical protein
MAPRGQAKVQSAQIGGRSDQELATGELGFLNQLTQHPLTG